MIWSNGFDDDDDNEDNFYEILCFDENVGCNEEDGNDYDDRRIDEIESTGAVIAKTASQHKQAQILPQNYLSSTHNFTVCSYPLYFFPIPLSSFLFIFS